MRRAAACILTLLLTTGFSLSAQVRISRLIAQGDSLHNAYLFDDAIEKYMQAADAGADEATIARLERKVQQSQNAINMTDFCADPNVVARERFSRKDFFQFYPLKSQSWRATPNVLDSLEGFPLYFPRGETSLIFTAQDGAGVRDLFYTHATDTAWTAPRLLGESLTTMGSEIFPMLSPDGKTLYFSSDGLPGMGGYDLYSSVWDEETQAWGEPSNMGFPFNSPADDFLLMDTEDGKYTIFASNRDCSRDSVYIYVLDYEGSRKRRIVREYADIVRIAALRPAGSLGRLDHDSFSESVEETDNTLLYNRKNAELRALRDSVAAHAADEDPARLLELRARMQVLNQEIEAIADIFLRDGVVREQEDKEVRGAGSAYSFGRNQMGPRLRLRIDRPRRPRTIRVTKVGRLSPDMSLPDGIVYQIQFARSTRHLDVEAFGGLSPVYERLSTRLSYIYAAGVFTDYYDAVSELNTVRKQGFPDAEIIAWKDGKQVSVQQARAEQNN